MATKSLLGGQQVLHCPFLEFTDYCLFTFSVLQLPDSSLPYSYDPMSKK